MAHLFPVQPEFAAKARYTAERYRADYAESVNDPNGFWKRIAGRLDWFKAPTQIQDVSFNAEDFRIRWYADGELNVSVNCLDRHLATRGDKTALLWEGDNPAEHEHVTYRDLYERTCRLANALRKQGVKKGDRVTIYLQPRWRCSPARASAPSIRSCSAASRRTRWSAASTIASRRW